MLINHHIASNSLLWFNLSNTIRMYNKCFQYLFYDLQLDIARNKIGRYFSLVNYNGYASFNLSKKKFYSDFLNGVTLNNFTCIDLSSLSYITSDSTNFKSDIFMRNSAILSIMDSWIEPRERGTNLLI
jgi:hypothetical protein